MRNLFIAAAFSASFVAGVAAFTVPSTLGPTSSDTLARVGSDAAEAFGSILTTPALADEPPAPIDTSKLVRIEQDGLEITYDDTVSLEPISQFLIRKIGYGHTTMVNVVRTSTGTYSSDAMPSPYVRYPGIEVSEKAKQADRVAGVLLLGEAGAWSALPLNLGAGSSFIYFGRMQGGGAYVTGENGTCFGGRGYFGCN